MVEAARKEILSRLYVEQYIEANTKPEKLKEYFKNNKKQFSNKEVRASHILLKEADKELAEKVLKEAKGGADFAELAKKHSTGPSKSRGGDLNYFGPGRMVPAFEKAAFSTAKDKVHPELVKTQFGWHIIKVTDVRGGDDVKFEDKKDQVEQTIKRNGRKDLIEELRKKANVKVNESVLNEIKF
nr:peptidylprolyl isomerase [Pseudobacteriovorax antillogorgiicola]